MSRISVCPVCKGKLKKRHLLFVSDRIGVKCPHCGSSLGVDLRTNILGYTLLALFLVGLGKGQDGFVWYLLAAICLALIVLMSLTSPLVVNSD